MTQSFLRSSSGAWVPWRPAGGHCSPGATATQRAQLRRQENVVDRRHARHNFSQPAMGPALASRLPGGPGPPAPSRPSHSRSSRVTGCPPVPVTWHLAEHKPVGRYFGEMSFSASSGASATGSGQRAAPAEDGAREASRFRIRETVRCKICATSIFRFQLGESRLDDRRDEGDEAR